MSKTHISLTSTFQNEPQPQPQPIPDTMPTPRPWADPPPRPEPLTLPEPQRPPLQEPSQRGSNPPTPNKPPDPGSGSVAGCIIIIIIIILACIGVFIRPQAPVAVEGNPTPRLVFETASPTTELRASPTSLSEIAIPSPILPINPNQPPVGNSEPIIYKIPPIGVGSFSIVTVNGISRNVEVPPILAFAPPNQPPTQTITNTLQNIIKVIYPKEMTINHGEIIMITFLVQPTSINSVSTSGTFVITATPQQPEGRGPQIFPTPLPTSLAIPIGSPSSGVIAPGLPMRVDDEIFIIASLEGEAFKYNNDTKRQEYILSRQSEIPISWSIVPNLSGKQKMHIRMSYTYRPKGTLINKTAEYPLYDETIEVNVNVPPFEWGNPLGVYQLIYSAVSFALGALSVWAARTIYNSVSQKQPKKSGKKSENKK